MRIQFVDARKANAQKVANRQIVGLQLPPTCELVPPPEVALEHAWTCHLGAVASQSHNSGLAIVGTRRQRPSCFRRAGASTWIILL